MQRISGLLLLGIGLLIGSVTAADATCPTFHTLTNGTTADATQVMDNFNYILTCPNFTGSVGIGTASPGTAFDLNGAFTERGMAAPALSAAGQGIIYFDSTSNTFRASQNGGAYTNLVGGGGGSGNLGTSATATNPSIAGVTNAGFFTPGANIVAVATAGLERTRWDASGNVGIGTTSPSALLSVNAATGSTTAMIQLSNTTNGNVTSFDGYGNLKFSLPVAVPPGGAGTGIFWPNQGANISIDSNQYMQIYNNSFHAMQIASNGVLTLFQNFGLGVIDLYQGAFTSQFTAFGPTLQNNRNNDGGWMISYSGSNGVPDNSRTGTLIVTGDIANGQAFYNKVFGNWPSQAQFNIVPNASNIVGQEIKAASGQTADLFDADSAAGAVLFNITGSGTVGVANLAGTGNRAVYSDANGNLTNSSSDARMKENVVPLHEGLDAVAALLPVSFNWRKNLQSSYGKQREIGLLAQDVRRVVPEVVGENHDHTLSVDYPKLTAVLAKAIQEQQAEIKTLQTEMAALKSKIRVAE